MSVMAILPVVSTSSFAAMVMPNNVTCTKGTDINTEPSHFHSSGVTEERSGIEERLDSR